MKKMLLILTIGLFLLLVGIPLAQAQVPPTITSPVDNALFAKDIIDATGLVVSGTGEPGNTIVLRAYYLDGFEDLTSSYMVLDSPTVNPDGTWSTDTADPITIWDDAWKLVAVDGTLFSNEVDIGISEFDDPYFDADVYTPLNYFDIDDIEYGLEEMYSFQPWVEDDDAYDGGLEVDEWVDTPSGAGIWWDNGRYADSFTFLSRSYPDL